MTGPDRSENRIFFKNIMDETMRFLSESPGRPGQYKYLVEGHIVVDVCSLRRAEDNIITGHKQPQPHISLPEHNAPFQSDPVSIERAWVYIENVPKVLSVLKECTMFVDHMEDSWWMMVLRMHIWNWATRLFQRRGMSVLSHYYDDPIPVYIL